MLKIGGFEKLSLSDYPGKLASVVFTYGCNLRCEYCHNPELVIRSLEYEFDASQILKYLEERKKKLDAVVITGGEPLIYSDLQEFLEKLKNLGYLVKLDTNGLLPNKLKKTISSELLDYISMDVKYPSDGYITYAGEDALENVKQSIEIIKNSGIDYEFRTTYVKGIHNTESSVEIGKMIDGAKQYYVQNFRSGKTIDPSLSESNSFTDKELLILKENIKPYVVNVEIR